MDVDSLIKSLAPLPILFSSGYYYLKWKKKTKEEGDEGVDLFETEYGRILARLVVFIPFLLIFMFSYYYLRNSWTPVGVAMFVLFSIGIAFAILCAIPRLFFRKLKRFYKSGGRIRRSLAARRLLVLSIFFTLFYYVFWIRSLY